MSIGAKAGRLTLAVLLALCALVNVPASAQDRAVEREFARSMMAQINAALPEATVTMGPDDPLEINIADHPVWDDLTINLHRAFAFCQTATQQECAAQRSDLLAAFSQTEIDLSREQLRIVVRDLEYWNYVKIQIPAEQVPPHRPIGDDLFAIIALDSPASISLLTPSDLFGLRLSEAEAWKIGREQTAAIIPQLPIGNADSVANGILAFQGDEYTASLMFDLDRWAQISAAVGPDMMVAPISDQVVIATGAPDVVEDIAGFKELAAEQCKLAPRCISPNVYHFRGGMWVIAD